MKNFKIGIIGFGNIGKKRLEAVKKIKKLKIEVVYISDIDTHTKVPKGIKFINNWRKVKDLNVDLVIISTPTYLTEIIAKEFAGNFNLLIEKPITTNLKLLNKITNKANKNKKILKTGYNLRFDKGLNIVKKIIDTNKIGKIYYCKITYANGVSKSNTNNVGSLVDMGAHSINLIQWLFDKSIIKVLSKFSQKNEFLNKKKIDNGFIFFKIKKTIILLHHGFCTWKNQFNLEISGSKGYVNISSLPKWGNQIVSLGLRKYPSGYPSIKFWRFNKDDSWRTELIYVIDMIINKKKNFKNINQEGKKTLELLNKSKN
jgi:predicted dehydrogenase